jgi:transcriptional regulator with XRE-family HTH domain
MESGGLFGTALADALDKNGMSIRRLAAMTKGTYEHLRKLIRGLAYPSPYRLEAICKILNMNLEEMDLLITRDKMQHKFGDNVSTIMERDPQSVKFDELTSRLTAEEADMFMTQMRAVINARKRGATFGQET